MKLRKTHRALSHGGLRWIAIEDEYLAYLRESKRQSILVFVSRGPVVASLDLSKYGYKVSKTLYGVEANGSRINIKAKTATQGVWLLH